MVLRSHSQLKIQTGEHYMAGSSFKKLHVCVEDHSVWALTQDGKVYSKKTTDQDFSIYPLTAALTVSSLTGFTADEMYFVSNNKILLIRNSIVTEVVVSFPGVTRINDISAVYGKNNETSINHGLNYKDYLAIATNKSYYYAIRGSANATLEHEYPNAPYVAEPDCEFSYTGFKALDLRYLSPQSYCIEVNRLTENRHLGYTQISWIPDKNGYNQVNATVFARNFYDPFNSSSSFINVLNIWGSTNGLFLKNINSCTGTIIKQRLDGESINDIEEIYALTPVYKQDYLIAASNTGIYYTSESIFAKTINDPTFANFVKLSDFPSLKVTAISTETDYLGIFSHGQDKYYSLCERVVWAATEAGIYKLYLSLDQDYFNNYKWADFRYSKLPSNNNYEDPEFQLCGTENVTISAKIPTDFSNQILVKWFKDDIEIPGSIGQLQMTLKDAGVYRLKVTSLCENITITSNPITIKYNTGPEITFAPPPNVVICNNQPYVMETKNVSNYTYQWYKDEIKITGATQFRYQATVNGKYRVEVNNNTCPSVQSSSSVELKFVSMPVPVLTKDKASYCVGDMAKLSVSNQGYETKWYKDGTEITDAADKDEIRVTQAGVYRAEFISSTCTNSSVDYPITFNELPIVTVSRSNNRVLCYGETVDLTANDLPGASYLWNTGEKTRTIKVGLPGSYSVKVTNANNCSSESVVTEVFVNEDLRFENPIIMTQKNDYCIGETAVLSVLNPKSLQIKWYLNGVELTSYANQSQFTTSRAGSYQVKFLNNLNCEKSSPVLPITFNNKLNVVISSATNRSICLGESITLHAGEFPNATYLWSNGEKTESIIVRQSGSFSVTVSSEFGCAITSDPIEIIVNSIPSVTSNERLKICPAIKQQLELKADPGFFKYNWSGQGGNGTSIKVSQPGLYSVQVEDQNGCKASKTFEVVSYCSEIIAPNAFSPNGDGVNDTWKVAGLEQEPNALIQIFNRLGTLVFSTQGSNPVWDGRIRGGSAPIGVYYYVISSATLNQIKNGIVTLIR